MYFLSNYYCYVVSAVSNFSNKNKMSVIPSASMTYL
jgi:hypothetical protein